MNMAVSLQVTPFSWRLAPSKDYQVALFKPYFDAGVKELAQVAGYPVAAIQSCGQLK